MKNEKLMDQIRRNQVALISLAIAITSLAYNSWRNEVSEANRTQRVVAIEVLQELAELQELTWHIHYGDNSAADNKRSLRTGWARVITIRDISSVLNAPLPDLAQTLWQIWTDRHLELAESENAKEAINDAIEMCRADTLALLQELE